ncbi:hypothetical protein EI94DRAFT_1724348 [Lactarius quietus]|nr:hypothetical protein EI94DRAFT_1724348 [Lactarius quietus]
MASPDLRIDGYLSSTFTPQVAEIYLSRIFRAEPQSVQAFSVHYWPGAFFVADPPMNHCRPEHIGNGRYAWLLDYVVRHGGSVVPQQLWSPPGEGGWRRVEQVQLHLPIFFVNADQSLGAPVSQAAAGQMSLQYPSEPVPLQPSDTTAMTVRIMWPGYTPFDKHVMVRNQTPARNPITLEKFVKYVGRSVQRFLECDQLPCDPHSKWTVGPHHITPDEVVLIGVVQVSAGSWMPILQLMNRIII